MRNSQRAVLSVIGILATFLVAAAVWIRVTAAQIPELSGERGSRTYDYTDFDRLEVSGQWEVTIERGETWRIAVEVPSELVEYVRAERDGDLLELGLTGGWFRGGGWGRDRDALKATITMPALEGLDLSGASSVSFSGFDGRELSIESSGASELRASSSRYDALRLVMSGAGSAELGDLTATNADVSISGAADIVLRMTGGRLTGKMSGASDLDYFGTVSEQSVSISGAGSVRRRD